MDKFIKNPGRACRYMLPHGKESEALPMSMLVSVREKEYSVVDNRIEAK